MALETPRQPTAPVDRAAVARLFDECLPRVYAYVGCRVEERSAAEEITAAAFRRAVEVATQEGFDDAAFGAIVFRVAATAVADHTRRTTGTFPHGVRAGDFDRDTGGRRAAGNRGEEVAARAYAAAMDRRALRQAMERLTDPQRRLIVLHYLDGLEINEQCAVLGWSRETYARRFNSALRALHVALAEGVAGAA